MWSAVVLTGGLAAGITTALFSVLDGVMFRPPPFAEADRLVVVDYRRVQGQIPPLEYEPALAGARDTLRERLDASPLVAGATQAGRATFFDPDDASFEGLRVEGVDARFFPLLGLSPALGRTFDASDERAPAAWSQQSADPFPVVLSHELARRLFGGDAAALGVRRLGGRRVRIIGVMPAGVKFPGDTNVWAPVPSDRNWPPTYVRLAGGATVSQLAGAFPALAFTPLVRAVHAGSPGALPLLFGAALGLLAVAWVQVTALTLSAGESQRRDLHVRLALGASRAALVRQWASEAGLTAAAMCAVAWATAAPLTAVVVRVLPPELTYGHYLSPDLRALAFVTLLSLGAFASLSVAPVAIPHPRLSLTLLAGGRDRPDGVERLRRLLVVGQVALTATLLYLSGLALRSFIAATRLDYGFDIDHVLVFTPPNWARPGRGTQQLFSDFDAFQDRMRNSVEQLRAVPGVVGASVLAYAPLGIGAESQLGHAIVSVDERPRPDVETQVDAMGAGFVRAMGARLVAGRSFDAPAYRGRKDVVIVNETLARQLSPPLLAGHQMVALPVVGRTLSLHAQAPRTVEVIGVVKDLLDAPGMKPAPQLFRPFEDGSAIGIRAALSVEASLPAIRATLEQTWGPLPDQRFVPIRKRLDTVLAPYRAQSVLLAIITACCLPIAAVGLLGAVTHSVQVRSHEIAIRLALGAAPETVRRLVVRRALLMVAAGLALGIAVGGAAERLIAHQFFGVQPVDPPTVLMVAAGLFGIGWLAAGLPGRAASRCDPAAALREM